MGLGLVFLLIFLALTGGLVIWVMSRLFPDFLDRLAPRHSASAASLDILNQRYVRGEISRDEYQEMRRALHAE